MKKIIPVLVGAFACTVSQLASALPVHATFDGTISGSSGIFGEVLNDFPVGTSASFDVTFDDAGFVASAPVTDLDAAPVSGWLRLGSLEWLFDAGHIYTYSYMLTPGNPILSYGLQLTGSGPTVSGGGSLFGLFLPLLPDVSPNPAGIPLAGFGYPFGGGTFFSYADLSGTFRTSRETTSVPEPNAGLLLCLGLALLACLRRFVVSKR